MRFILNNFVCTWGEVGSLLLLVRKNTVLFYFKYFICPIVNSFLFLVGIEVKMHTWIFLFFPFFILNTLSVLFWLFLYEETCTFWIKNNVLFLDENIMYYSKSNVLFFEMKIWCTLIHSFLNFFAPNWRSRSVL